MLYESAEILLESVLEFAHCQIQVRACAPTLIMSRSTTRSGTWLCVGLLLIVDCC